MINLKIQWIQGGFTFDSNLNLMGPKVKASKPSLSLFTSTVRGKTQGVFQTWTEADATRCYRVVSMEFDNWEIGRWHNMDLSCFHFVCDLKVWRDTETSRRFTRKRLIWI
ncbi:uncharacterized protein LOC124888158 [Capsicum annuum]|uniref:uncharacterized protein LOC124888158 n=1 Tax=Capsicum annuum TaxID=4072 RepID=UPI001FB0A66E|nr:uncharacterized protein LOC124888158 [Capsicum annuum]